MIILLDIDGVMIPMKGWKLPNFLPDGFPDFTRRAVASLNVMIEAGGTILLTTSHKFSYSVTEWERIFKTRGVKPCEIGVMECSSRVGNRAADIMEWAEGRTEDFVIVDDDSGLGSLPVFIRDRWIRTQPTIGLTPADISRKGYPTSTGVILN